MRRALNMSDWDQQEGGLKATFNVVMIYEDFETGKHAKRTYDFLVQNLAGEFSLSNQMWKFDVLTIPKLAEIAAQDALAADIIIVSSRGGQELPPHVCHWMEMWVGGEMRAQALVALFQGDEFYTQNGVRRYLAEAAKRAVIEFFEQPGSLSVGQPATGMAAQSQATRQDRAFTTLTGALNREMPVPRWGINE